MRWGAGPGPWGAIIALGIAGYIAVGIAIYQWRTTITTANPRVIDSQVVDEPEIIENETSIGE